MDQKLLGALRARSSAIRERWEALMRTERTISPMANPDLLVHLFEETLHEIFVRLEETESCDLAVTLSSVTAAECPCGSNPLIAYFSAGEQALLEGLILIQAEAGAPNPDKRDHDVMSLLGVWRTIARREISGFCGVCQRNPAATKRALA